MTNRSWWLRGFFLLAAVGCGGGTLGGGTGGDDSATGQGGVGGTAVVGSGGVAGADSPGTAGTGVAGITGAAGTTGRGGVTGGGGVTGNWCFEPLNCGVSVCGNGTRDACTIPTIDCHGTKSFMETCDGADLGGQTCASRGYASGTLSCSTICTFDEVGCSECAPLGANVTGCGPAPLPDGTEAGLALAATDSEVALAWADDNGDKGIAFTRLSPGLAVLSTTRIDEAYPDTISVAPLPAGWAVAGHNTFEIFTHAVDASGVDRGRIVVDNLSLASNGDSLFAPPRIAARPNGGPLIVWATRDAVRVSVVSADGKSATTPKSFSTIAYPLNIVLMNAAYVNDAFYVAMQVALSQGIQLVLLRVETDGTPGTVLYPMPTVEAFIPSLVTGADDLRVVYTGTNGGQSGVWWRRFGLDGTPASPPALITDGVAWLSGVAMGTDTVLAMGDSSSGALPNHYEMARVGTDGVLSTPAFDVVKQPGDGFPWQAMARRGPDVVFAWAPPSGPIQIARVTP